MKLCRSVAYPDAARRSPLCSQPHLLVGLLLACQLLLTSCTTPKLRIWSNPMDSAIHMDGVPAGLAPMSVEPTYYGTLLLHGEEQVGEADITIRRTAFYGAKVQKVDFSAPVSRWLFGLDLIGEAIARLFGNMNEQVDIELPLVQAVPLFDPDTGRPLEPLMNAAEAASLAR